MPPCKSTLLNKIKRTNKIARIIKQCSLNEIDLPNGNNDGWSLGENGTFCIEYYLGNPYPDHFACNEMSDPENDDYVQIDDNIEVNNSSDESDNDFN